METAQYDYVTAFSRNLGWLTEDEQNVLRGKRVAIAGMGGVGGFHLLTLARLGVEQFHIADLDEFELANFNRQAGATMRSLGRHKAETLAEMALDINPAADVQIFREGVDQDNLATFFAGADLYVDGLDFFAFEAREMVFEYCHARGIPATTAAPLGMGAALLNFLPTGCSFEDFFQWRGRTELEKAVHFLVGLAPNALHRSYLMDPTRINLAERRGPSTVMACNLCAGIVGAEALKILLGRGRVFAAPHGFQFDAYRNRLAHTWRPGGNRNPLNRVAIGAVKRMLGI